eukprot:CAMPEP_0113679930 /NCGR_PEP_ID=MMETSP0038_2-20120614/10961_1 /TAXON_ID=2898 /ORGANISM="Cryptomonas paramecium" /LENGTH=175 /DNA_ID=CAMNT_0000598103 /DNA_START=318 /DNA_END=842 /DNA_ORIENTATION=+ /assembly_acc=CAM_ASM_000170
MNQKKKDYLPPLDEKLSSVRKKFLWFGMAAVVMARLPAPCPEMVSASSLCPREGSRRPASLRMQPWEAAPSICGCSWRGAAAGQSGCFLRCGVLTGKARRGTARAPKTLLSAAGVLMVAAGSTEALDGAAAAGAGSFEHLRCAALGAGGLAAGGGSGRIVAWVDGQVRSVLEHPR